jgi:hypothetical protein
MQREEKEKEKEKAKYSSLFTESCLIYIIKAHSK